MSIVLIDTDILLDIALGREPFFGKRLSECLIVDISDPPNPKEIT